MKDKQLPHLRKLGIVYRKQMKGGTLLTGAN